MSNCELPVVAQILFGSMALLALSIAISALAMTVSFVVEVAKGKFWE